MTTNEEELEKFGELLVCYVQKVSVKQSGIILRPDYQGADAQRWREAAAAAGGVIPPGMMIPETVDTTVFEILRQTDDQEVLHFLFNAKSGENIDLVAEGGGELGGWYIGVPGWRSWYSSERIPDRYDFAYVSAEYGVPDDSDDPAPNLDELDMPRRAIEELGILLVQHVRDVAIRSCDEQLLPSSNTPTAQRWRRIAAEHNGVVPPEFLIPDCVDEAILAFLRAIDQGLLPLSFVAENGDVVDLVKDGRGELAARYADWRAKYSQQRFEDGS